MLNADGSEYSIIFMIASCTTAVFPMSFTTRIPRTTWWCGRSTLEDKDVWGRFDASDKDVWGLFVGPEGTPDPGGAFPIATVTDVIEKQPAVVVDPSNGRYLVVFSHDTTGNFNIGGQRLYSGGTKNGSLLAISGDPGDELSPDIAFNPKDDWAFVAWQHDVSQRERRRPRVASCARTTVWAGSPPLAP